MTKRDYKVHRNFKLDTQIDRRLRREAKTTGKSQTRILEQALAAFFLIKN